MSARLQICGAVVDGPPPLGLIDVSLEPGCRAFYGLNGVGKTRLLTALTELCAGRPHGAGYLYARFVDSTGGADDSEIIEELCESLEREVDWLRRWAPESLRDDEPVPEPSPWNLRGQLRELILRMMWFRSSQSAGPIDVDYLREIAGQDWLILRPNGDDRWQLEAGLRVPDSPRAARDLQRLVACRARIFAAAGIDPGADDLERVWSQMDDRPVQNDSPLTSRGVLWDSFHRADAFLEDLAVIVQNPLVVRPVLEADLMEFQRPFVTQLGELNLFEQVTDIDLDPTTIDRITREAMIPTTFRLRPPFSDCASDEETTTIVSANDEVVPASEIVTAAAELTERADAIHQSFGSASPPIRCHVRHPDEWFLNDPVEWQCGDASGEWIGLKHLSTARARWASLAAMLAILQRGDDIEDHCGRLLIAMDEPESGLHVRAERQAVQALASLAENTGAVILLATHSKWFLNDPRVHLTHVFQSSSGRTAAKQMPPDQRASIDILGLEPADALHLVRAFLIVEGRHEEVILRVVIGTELDLLGVHIIPIRGARNLAGVADARLLADFTDVPLIVMLDNARTAKIESYWSDLTSLPSTATELIDELGTRHFEAKKTAEEGFITQLARRLHEQGRLDRCRVHGLSRTDIIRYLHVSALVPGAQSWSELEQAHAQQLENRNPIRDFKRWATESRSADFSDDSLRRACGELDEIPADLGRLVDAIARAVG